jgi:hypothetical protein
MDDIVSDDGDGTMGDDLGDDGNDIDDNCDGATGDEVDDDGDLAKLLPSMRRRHCRRHNSVAALVVMALLPSPMRMRLAAVNDDGDSATGDKVNDDGDGATGDDVDNDGKGATYDDIDDDCNGATGGKVDYDCDGATGAKVDDDGDGATGYDDDDYDDVRRCRRRHQLDNERRGRPLQSR